MKFNLLSLILFLMDNSVDEEIPIGEEIQQEVEVDSIKSEIAELKAMILNLQNVL